MSNKRLKIVVVGLPMFAQRMVEQLEGYDPQVSYRYLDTYYSRIDKVRALYTIPTSDILYSINGNIVKSRSFDLALKKGKKLVMHWVGSDVIRATDAVKRGVVNQAYVEKAVHLCEVDWIKEELEEIGIKARVLNFLSFESKAEVSPFSSDFNVLSYMPAARQDFYGVDRILALAKKCPDVTFNVVGSEKGNHESLPNVMWHGWVDNMDEYMQKAVVCIRCTDHDGLSSSVLEALSSGRYVLYNNRFPGTSYCEDVDQMAVQLTNWKQHFDEGQLELNEVGRAHIREHFSREGICRELTDFLKSL